MKINFYKIKKIFITFLLLAALIIFSIGTWNRKQIMPTPEEVTLLKDFYGDISIKDSSDIIRLQNKTVNDIKHEVLSDGRIDLIKVIENRKGFCYHRSLLLQKVVAYNNIKIRPVYLYFNSSSNNTGIFEFFNHHIESHNVFEYNWKNKWYLMRTNKAMKNFITLDKYLKEGKTVPSHSRYVRFLNNRNGKFIYPSWVPDFYW